MEIRKSPVRREAVPDPRFAAPEAPLVCTINRQKKAFRQHEEKAIGKLNFFYIIFFIIYISSFQPSLVIIIFLTLYILKF